MFAKARSHSGPPDSDDEEFLVPNIRLKREEAKLHALMRRVEELEAVNVELRKELDELQRSLVEKEESVVIMNRKHADLVHAAHRFGNWVDEHLAASHQSAQPFNR